MMNYLQSILRNGVTLVVIAVLFVVTLWLVWSQRSTPQPMAQATTEETNGQPTLTPSVQPLLTEATTEPGPSPTTPFIFVTPYYLETPVANPSPTPTFTPTPIPAVKVLSKEPIPLQAIPGVESKGEGKDSFSVAGWTPDGSIIVQRHHFAPTDEVGVEQTWAVQPNEKKAKQLFNLPQSIEITSSAAQEELIKELKTQAEGQEKYSLCFVLPSPDELHLAVWAYQNFFTSRAAIYRVDEHKPLVSLLNGQQVELNCASGGVAWSHDGKYLAYSFRVSYTFEIYITDLTGNTIAKINLPSEDNPSEITWSPDDLYLAFNLAVQPQQIPDIFVVKADGTGLVNMTQDGASDTPFYWSPNNAAIAYNRHIEKSGIEIPYLIQFPE